MLHVLEEWKLRYMPPFHTMLNMVGSASPRCKW